MCRDRARAIRRGESRSVSGQGRGRGRRPGRRPLQAGPRVAAGRARLPRDKLLGHAYLNAQYVDASGYSGKPINILVGLDLDGTIVGARLVSHGEPIVLIGIPEQKVVTYLQAFVGYNPNHHASVSVAARHATLADGLSTTLSVLPPAQGIALLERFPSTRATSWTPPAGSGRTACPDGEKRGRPPCAPRTADGAGDARDTASRPCPFPGRPNRS